MTDPRYEALKADNRAQAGRMIDVIESNAPEMLTYLRVGDPRLIEKVLTVRMNDIKNQMANNRDNGVHLELIGRIAQLKEIIATFHYVRM